MSTTRLIVSLLALSSGLLATTGCASYVVRAMDNPAPRYYPGMRSDARMIVQPSKVTWAASTKTVRVVFGTLDIVPSTAVDTLCLPYELTVPVKTNPPACTLEPTAK